ncbi:adhesion G protein-coupled receptor L4-like isoform X2 [Dysidea avara]|uniref:adhesion G protein-coupled receptor L4-like isoform X2 n=1 Tax=Dysidea avara TaxID=196820 RepID=UPI00333408B6
MTSGTPFSMTSGTPSSMTSGTPSSYSNRNSVIAGTPSNVMAGTPSSVMAGTPSSVTNSIVETSPIMINSIAGTSSSMTRGAPSSYSSATSHVLGTPASIIIIETPSSTTGITGTPSNMTSGTPFSVTSSLIGTTPIVSVEFCSCFNNIADGKAMINSTRRILCNITTDFKFVTQICSTFEDDEIQPNWFPELPVTCVENGLAISETLFRINSNVTDVADQIEALLLYLNDTTTSITAGDLILSSNILVEATQVGCSRNNQTFLEWSLLLENTAVIEILEKNQQLVFVYNLFTATDLYAFNCYDKNTSLSTNSIRLIVLKLDLSDLLRNITSVSLSHDNLATFVIPGSVLEAAQTEGESEFTAVSYLINGLQNILSSRSLSGSEALYRLVSPVVSLTTSCSFQSCADAVKTDGIEFVIKHNTNISNGSSTVCAFWNFSIAREYEPFWSTEGCKKIDQTAERTKCVCNHLTHFGILFDSRGGSSQISSENKTALSLVTYLGVGFSLLALILTMISFVILRSQWSLRTFVHINLCCTLFFAQLIFVLGIDKTSNDVVCATIAVLLHYLFLTTFMWMLTEGVVLYIVLVKVFAQIDWKYYTGFTLLCYGGPLLYMILCVPLGLARRNEWSYGSDDFCWLTYNDHFIWAFIAPVLVLITINIGFLIMAIRIMKRHQTEAAVAERTSKERAWYWFRGSMSLIIIMGINWVFGVILFHEYILPLIYLFAITTSLQPWIDRCLRRLWILSTSDEDSEQESRSIQQSDVQGTLSSHDIRRVFGYFYYLSLVPSRSEMTTASGFVLYI